MALSEAGGIFGWLQMGLEEDGGFLWMLMGLREADGLLWAEPVEYGGFWRMVVSVVEWNEAARRQTGTTKPVICATWEFWYGNMVETVMEEKMSSISNQRAE